MRLSKFHLLTLREDPAEAEVVSHRLMLRAGMIRKLAAGIYTWAPLGYRVLRKVEAIVREEMARAGALEVLMPAVQPKELWQETGRWERFGPQLLKMRDRKDAEYCFGPTHEEVITDFARAELRSYKQLPVNFFQIQWKFRDEIRPRFGVMRAREFLMKDAYSFHLDRESLEAEYWNMYRTYARILERIGLKYRAVLADTGAIGGALSHEFHVLADSGEDRIAYSDASDYAANVELAEAAPPQGPRPPPKESLRKVPTPSQRTCPEVAELLGIPLERTVKTIALIDGEGRFTLALLRGDHDANPIKLAKLPKMAEYRLASEEEIRTRLGAEPGFLGPVGIAPDIRLIVDREVAVMADFVVGANETGYHLAGVNFGRDLPEPEEIADIREVVEGDLAPDGQGRLRITRGIEVGHVFQLGTKYSAAMGATVLDAEGRSRVLEMGCYGIGVSRLVAAAIEQHHDERGIIWPEAIAPWQVAICPINPRDEASIREAAESLYAELWALGIETVLDDRGLRPGPMFADIELIGIPHRVVVSERGLASGTFEYRHRRAEASEPLDRPSLLARLREVCLSRRT
ncbi:MAG: proline--tRNA ligase [Lysobacterales bacterium]|jgi:prolyl-tRNA synthetase|nr:MAG: proline--tRNA ligase [Xanthomonadales bacterium]